MGDEELPGGVRVLRGRDALLAATGGAQVVAYEGGDDGWPALARDGAVLFGRLTQRGTADVVGLGGLESLRALLSEVDAAGPGRLGEPWASAGSLTVEAGNEALHAEPHASWATMAVRRGRLAGRPDGPEPAELTGADDEIRAFLDAHHTSMWASPGLMPGERWYGIREAGNLVAVGSLHPTPAGTRRIAGIAVARDARGRGLGKLMSWHATAVGLEASEVVVLGVDDHGPEGLYAGLGYEVSHRWRSSRRAWGVGVRTPT